MRTSIKSKRHDGFKRGGDGVYTCGSCGIKTRRTRENSHTDSETCADCFELAGIYNSYQDGDVETVMSYKDEIVRRCKNITDKGGTLDSDALELLRVTSGDKQPVDTKEMDAALHSLAQEAATKHEAMEIVTNTAIVQSYAINAALSAAMRSFQDTTGKTATAEQTNALRQAFIKFYEG